MMFERPKKAQDLYGCDPSKPSRAVLASNGSGAGIVISYVGGHLGLEIKEYDCRTLEDLGLDDCEAGIWIWEGTYHYSGGVNSEGIDEGGESTAKGAFRAPTDDEWAAIREHRCPWNALDWAYEEKPS